MLAFTAAYTPMRRLRQLSVVEPAVGQRRNRRGVGHSGAAGLILARGRSGGAASDHAAVGQRRRGQTATSTPGSAFTWGDGVLARVPLGPSNPALLSCAP